MPLFLYMYSKPLNNGHISALCVVLKIYRCPLLGGLFVLKSSIRACHVVHLIGVLYSDCQLMCLLYNIIIIQSKLVGQLMSSTDTKFYSYIVGSCMH